MSSLIVEVCKISDIKPHPNADRMEIAVVKGWECCVKKGAFQKDDKCIYFPIDTILPESVSDKFGVTKYLSKGRIRATRLRSYPSCGLVMPCNEDVWNAAVDPPGNTYSEKFWKVKTNVADMFGCIKWEPPQEITQGDMEKEHPLFSRYTDIENIKNFPYVLKEGEMVVITEKIHGTNSRVGLLKGEFVAGSHKTQRKNPDAVISIKQNIVDFYYRIKKFVKTGNWNRPSIKASKNNTYWIPLKNENLREMMRHISKEYKADQVIVFGEIFGKGVQDLTYGRQREVDYRVFDIIVNGEYMNYILFKNVCEKFNISMVPVIYEGVWDNSLIEKYSSGNSVVSDIEQIREGFVVKPIFEREDPEIGRVILKSISFEYLDRKKGTENH